MELLVIIIVLALIFDYINGFHDAANSIATIVSTKVLTPFQAVIWAAFFNFVAFFIAKCVIGGFGIANTVSKTVMEPYITLPIILAGVIAAIAWNLFTWWKGIPSSSSHTLIGGFAGAAIMAHGFEYHSEDCGIHFSGSLDWYGGGIWFYVVGLVHLPQGASPYGRGVVQETAAGVFGFVQHRARSE